MSRQKELGNRIAAARKQKGLTQEELAKKCSISTRTLQRIEAGSVTPRPYTLNCLTDALAIPREDIADFLADLSADRSWFEISRDAAADLISPPRIYTTAWIAALICLALTIPDIVFDVSAMDTFHGTAFIIGYTAFNLLFILPIILRSLGVISLARHHDNDLLLVSAYILLFLGILDRFSSVVFIHFWTEDLEKLTGFIWLLLIGSSLILYGIGMKRLGKIPVPYAGVTGVLAIVIGISFVTIIPFLIGLMLLIPLALAEILLLYKASKMLHSENTR